MKQDGLDLMEVLKFELSFLEDGGYGRSPQIPIALSDKGATIDYFYRRGTQADLEAVLCWLRCQVSRLEQQHELGSKTATELTRPALNKADSLRRKQWLAFAESLHLLANRHREDQNYAVAHALYGRALEAVEKVTRSDGDSLSLAASIRRDRQIVSDILQQVQEEPRMSGL